MLPPSTVLFQTLPNLEGELESELRELIPSLSPSSSILSSHPGGVVLSAPSTPAVYPLLLWARIPTKALLLLSEATVVEATPEALNAHARSVLPPELFRPPPASPEPWLSFSVSTSALCSLPPALSHSKFTSINVAKAITDSCRASDPSGTRPPVNLDDADVPLHCFLSRPPLSSPPNSVSVSLYASLISARSSHRLRSPDSLPSHPAALKSTTAAALVRKTGLPKLLAAVRAGSVPAATFLDPMCGGGTFLLEAAQLAADAAPLLAHAQASPLPIAALRWRGADEAAWGAAVAAAAERRAAGAKVLKGGQVRVVGNDAHAGSVGMARRALGGAGFGGVEVSLGGCDEVALGKVEGAVILAVNPPWGGRLTEDLEKSWEALGRALRSEGMRGQEAWVLSPPSDLSGLLRMKAERKLSFSAARDKLRFTQYKIRA
ncbi:hypothetical protein TeGR_g12858 [Tetraparma gracilis]|uniref:Ribosomal RNA large subunit methyltransferase K/L-like methyltransferase domain-containing protein n=1 Tax=Tetraparma gracilis TaxID=2962635 RepID=A0ABQ6N2Q1_9STRA|nr:hypothetical protein TeGR_g12858 [Tetraparma gracilis]